MSERRAGGRAPHNVGATTVSTSRAGSVRAPSPEGLAEPLHVRRRHVLEDEVGHPGDIGPGEALHDRLVKVGSCGRSSGVRPGGRLCGRTFRLCSRRSDYAVIICRPFALRLIIFGLGDYGVITSALSRPWGGHGRGGAALLPGLAGGLRGALVGLAALFFRRQLRQAADVLHLALPAGQVGLQRDIQVQQGKPLGDEAWVMPRRCAALRWEP